MREPMAIPKLPLQTAVDHYLVALRVEGAAPTTIATYRSVLAAYLRWATAEQPPSLADFPLVQVRTYAAYLMGEQVRFSHHRTKRAGGRLSDHTINLRGQMARPVRIRHGSCPLSDSARARHELLACYPWSYQLVCPFRNCGSFVFHSLMRMSSH